MKRPPLAPHRSGHRRAPPRLALLENVRGLLSTQGEPDPEWVAELARKAVRWQVVIHHVIEPKIRKARRRGQLDRITASKPTPFACARAATGRGYRATSTVPACSSHRSPVTWPTSGMSCGGTAFALPTWAQRTDVPVFLFAVPADSDAGQARTAPTGRHGHPVAGVGGSALTLLPTPVADNSAAECVDRLRLLGKRRRRSRRNPRRPA